MTNKKKKCGRPRIPRSPCMTDGCNKMTEVSGAGRGLCKPCYNRALYMIRSGKTTWEELEALALCKPLKINPFKKAFLRAKSTTESNQE